MNGEESSADRGQGTFKECNNGDLALLNWPVDRAIDFIGLLFHDDSAAEKRGAAIVLLQSGLLNLHTDVEQNRGSIANEVARYRVGKRIASTSDDAGRRAGGNSLVARRIVKKQQMRYSERGANLFL